MVIIWTVLWTALTGYLDCKWMMCLWLCGLWLHSTSITTGLAVTVLWLCPVWLCGCCCARADGAIAGGVILLVEAKSAKVDASKKRSIALLLPPPHSLSLSAPFSGFFGFLGFALLSSPSAHSSFIHLLSNTLACQRCYNLPVSYRVCRIKFKHQSPI